MRVGEHACDDASKRILKLSRYRLQILLVKDQYLRSLLSYGDQIIAGQLEKHLLKPMLAILTTYMETRLQGNLQERPNRGKLLKIMLIVVISNSPYGGEVRN